MEDKVIELIVATIKSQICATAVTTYEHNYEYEIDNPPILVHYDVLTQLVET